MLHLNDIVISKETNVVAMAAAELDIWGSICVRVPCPYTILVLNKNELLDALDEGMCDFCPAYINHEHIIIKVLNDY